MSLWVYIFRRILQALPLLFVISIMGFTMMRLAPIDPLAYLKANPAISQETIKAEEERLGLNEPAAIQYIYWLTNMLKGDLGISTTGGSVSVLLLQRAGNTLLLSLATVIFTWLIAIPSGVYAAVYRNTIIDRILSILTAIGMSMPTFLLALLLLMVATKTHTFPIGGLTSQDFFERNIGGKLIDIVSHLVIPVMVLTLIGLAAIQRQMRASLLDVLQADYVRTARAKGLKENSVIYIHAVKTAINPLITLFGFEFADLLSGAALTETVLAYPGLGRLTLEAVQCKDMNLVMASLMLGAIMLITGNLIADILLKFADPRISLG